MSELNLAAYAARIGVAVPETIDLASLGRLHQAHVGAIPFENLDVQWRRGIRIDLPHVADKLLERRRGGYCFEQNTLFREVLRARGVAVATREARVRSGATSPRARTHMTLVATLGGRDHLCDVGFGGYTPLHPVPLDGEPSRQGAWTYRVAPEAPRLVLQWLKDGGWQDLYAIEPGEPQEIDLLMANWFTSTSIEGGFMQTVTAQRATPDVRYILRKTMFYEDHGDALFTRTLRREEIVPVLRAVFGLDVPDDADFPGLEEPA